MEILRYVHRLLLGIWLGALLCFGAVVAPTLFKVLTPGQAGQVVRRVLPVLDGYGAIAGVVLLAVGWVVEGAPRGRARLRVGALAGATLAAWVSLFVVTPRMSELRAQAADQISELPADHPLRREFGKLHGVSSSLSLAALLLGGVALAVPLRKRESPG